MMTVFCDFDGTMTTQDLVVAVWRRFAPPGWERQVQDIIGQRKTVRAGVAEVFATIPSSLAPEIAGYVESIIRFRTGLREFLEFCQRCGISFVVASGGLDFFVSPVLEPFSRWLAGVHTIPAQLDGPTIRLRQPYPCPECGLCKAAVMDQYDSTYRLLVGDGITDLHGARHADAVFARGHLRNLLGDLGKPFVPFEDFLDLRDSLEALILERPDLRNGD